MVEIILFVLGSCFGSFVNVVADRLPRGENIFLGHSHCDKCKKIIKPFDLFPIISYLLLKGKCRYCKYKIPLRVFFVEFLSGSFFVLLFSFGFINWIVYALYCGIFLTLLAITLIDLDYGIIPDKLLILFGILSIILVLGDPTPLLVHIISAFSSFLFFVTIFLVTRGRGIGFGDVKYSLVIGFLLTPIALVIAFYIAFLTGALISIILIVRGKKKLRGGSVAFGPFLSLGVIIALLFENYIVRLVLPVLGF